MVTVGWVAWLDGWHAFRSTPSTRNEVAQTVIETLLTAKVKLGTLEVIAYQGDQLVIRVSAPIPTREIVRFWLLAGGNSIP